MSGAWFVDTLSNARAQQIINAINAGAGKGSILFYTAPEPAEGVAISTQTLLATCVFAEPAAIITNGVITYNPLNEDALVDADGLVEWARILSGTGDFVMDLSVTDNNGQGPIRMPVQQVYQGGILICTSMVLTEGNN